MKIRIHDDSIRLRLDRDEVNQIGRGTTIACTTHFPDGAGFGYHLGTGPVDSTRATFSDGCIALTLPNGEARRWAEDETAVSIDVQQPLADGASLRLLVEKDFECLEPRAGESQSNRFRNPKAVG